MGALTTRKSRALVVQAVMAASLLCGLTWAALAPAVAAPAAAGSEAVWARGDEFVKLVPSEPGALPNQHPAGFAAADLASALACISLHKDGAILPLLERRDAARLAPYLAQAFAKAG